MNILTGVCILASLPVVLCQDERTEDFHIIYTTSEPPHESITNYGNVHRESSRNVHPVKSLDEYHQKDGENESNEEDHGSDIARSDYRRRIFHIKNPFQHQLDQNGGRNIDEFGMRDNDNGASDQYAAMQYSLPPDEFLQRMRAERFLQQISTSAPMEYTATPQPQYQYSSKFQSYYNPNQVSQSEQKDFNVQNYQNPSQYVSPVSYSYNALQTTPSSISNYMSTPSPDIQYVSTSGNSQPHVSSVGTTYLSSSSNPQQYESYPLSTFQSLDYNNHLTTATNTIADSGNDAGNTLHIHHYDNSANGVRHPLSIQYQSETTPTTLATPVSSLYTDVTRDIWQNAIGANSLTKSLQDFNAISQYQNQIQNGLQDSRSAINHDNSDTRTISNLASSNSVLTNFPQHDYSSPYDTKSRTRHSEQGTTQPERYSHGDYGWKLSTISPLSDSYAYSTISYGHSNPKTLAFDSNYPRDAAYFQNKLHTNNLRTSYYTQPSESDHSQNYKTLSYTLEAKEFAKAAAKAHESMKEQRTKANEPYYNYDLVSNHGISSIQHSTNAQPNVVSTFYGNNNKQSKYSILNPSNEQNELVTASPFNYSNKRETIDGKSQQPFDHVKALKNIVPIDERNVLENLGLKTSSHANINQYDIHNYKIDSHDNVYNKPLIDAYYEHKNFRYGIDDVAAYKKEHQNQDLGFSRGSYSDHRAGEILPRNNFLSQMINSYQEQIQQPTNIQQSQQKSHIQDLDGVLRLNDIPQKLTQSLSANELKFHNSNFDHGYIPQPIPSRINQNVDSHQLDVTNDILNKILSNNRQIYASNNQNNNIDLQTGSSVSAINGFKVSNPFNIDLRIVEDILKGKPVVDESSLALLREQFSKPVPLKVDMPTLQQLLLKDNNYGSLNPYVGSSTHNGATIIRNPFIDAYRNGPNHHQSLIKYSRSQEEEESFIPVAKSADGHHLNAFTGQDDLANREIPGVKDLTRQDENGMRGREVNFENRPRHIMSSSRDKKENKGYRYVNSFKTRPGHQKKVLESNMEEPYPLLKPPPPVDRVKGARFARNKNERRNRRRRLSNKMYRTIKLEPPFKSNTLVETESESRPILLKPPLEENFVNMK